MTNYPDDVHTNDIPGHRPQDKRNIRAYERGAANGHKGESPAVFIDYDERTMEMCLIGECEMHGMQGYFDGFMYWRGVNDANLLVSPDPVLYYICEQYKKAHDREKKMLRSDQPTSI